MTKKSEETMLDELLQLDTDSDRSAYLLDVCGYDVELRGRLELLLKEHHMAGQFFSDVEHQSETLEQVQSEKEPPEALSNVEEGARIGRYRILEKIGEGGMGAVYMAEQTEPVSRKVALKVIKLGMDTKQVIARFEAERQALALMDHPNIARVLDAGATESGRPYFVMELVRGLSITEYCQKMRMVISERLKLFIKVCEAVQSAHQKGIIHRDIKPSNILVTLNHGDPVPKVIDFGVAKATNQRLTEKTLFTRFSQMIGTPAYMSPEQSEMTSLDVDTRADVYSLGVLLYELLVGSAPFTEKELLSLGYREMQRVIQEVEPDKPSTRITKTGSADRLAPCTEDGGGSVLQLARLLEGDLDWICMKALEKDRRRRYGTPSDLAADVKRHLRDEPVTAAAPSLGYQLGKLYKRRRTQVRAILAVVIIAIFSVLVTSGLAFRLNQLWIEAVVLRASESQERVKSEQERDRALIAERNLELQSEELRQQLYVSDLLVVEDRIENGELMAGRVLLERHIPVEGKKDLRGFEWRYYWDQSRGNQLSTLQAHDEGITDLEVSPGGRFLATIGRDGLVKLWDLNELSLLHQWNVGGKRGGRIEFSSDEKHLMVGTEIGMGSSQIFIKDLATKQDAWVPEGQWGYVSMSPPGTHLLTLRGNGNGMQYVESPGAQIWDYDKKAALFDLELPAILAEWSPTGTMLAIKVQSTTSAAPVVEVWEVATRTKVNVMTDMRSTKQIAFSPDETKLAMAGGRKQASVYVWDLKADRILCELTGHESMVTEVRFHPKEPDHLVSCSSDQSIRIWNWKSQRQVKKLTGQSSEITSISFTRDGETVVTGGKDGRVMLWSSGIQRSENLIPDAYTIDSPKFSASGRFVNLEYWTKVMFPGGIDGAYDFKTRAEAAASPPEPARRKKEEPPLRVDSAFRLISLANEHEMPASGRDETIVGRMPDGGLRFRVFLPDGMMYLDKSEEDFAHRTSLLAAFKEALAPLSAGESFPDEQRIKLATMVAELDRGSKAVIWQDAVFETKSGSLLWKVSTRERPVGFLPDESSLLTLTTNRVFFRHALTGQLERTIGFAEPIWNANFGSRGSRSLFDLSPNGQLIAVTEKAPAIRIIDVETGATKATLDEMIFTSHVSFIPNGEQILYRSGRNADGNVESGLWNPRTDAKTVLLGEGTDKIEWLSVSPDSRLVAGVCEDNAMRIWRVEDGGLERTIRGLREGLSKVAFTPDGRSLALVRSRESKIRFWNTQTWRPVAALDRVPSAFDSLGFSPDGLALLMSSRGGTRVWRAPKIGELGGGSSPPHWAP